MKEKNKLGWKLHLIIALAMLAIILVCVFKLWKCNTTDTVVLEEVEAGTFDYESLDFVFNVDSEILAEHGTDDINTILVIGDDVMTHRDTPESKNLVEKLEEIPDSEIISLCLGSTSVSDTQNAYTTDDVTYWQAGNLYDVLKALATRDFSLQKEALDNDAFITADYYATLSSVDLNEIDTLFIMYSSVDYLGTHALYNPEDDYDTSTYEGALRASIHLIQDNFPHIRIVVGSPFLHNVMLEDGSLVPATTINYGNGNLSEFVMRGYNIAMECCVSYEDNFFGLISEETVNDYSYFNYLLDPGVELIGDHMVQYFQLKY